MHSTFKTLHMVKNFSLNALNDCGFELNEGYISPIECPFEIVRTVLLQISCLSKEVVAKARPAPPPLPMYPRA